MNKISLVLKELKETSVGLKTLDYISYGDSPKHKILTEEAEKLCRISAKTIFNKKNKK